MSFLLQTLFLLGFPSLVAVCAAYLSWGVLPRPWLFLLASSVGLYVLYALAFYLFGPESVGYVIAAVEPGEVRAPEPWLIWLEPYAKPIIVFAIAAVPATYALVRLFAKPGQR